LEDASAIVVAQLISMDSDLASIDLTLESQITFGRKPSCTVQLNDLTVSGKHCCIYYDDKVPMGSFVDPHGASPPWTPGRATTTRGETFYGASNFWVEDLSSNGTYVNMVKLGRGNRARLCHHDQIALSTTEAKRGTKCTKNTFLFAIPHLPRMNQQEYPTELVLRYDIREVLGVGAFSEVKMAIERSTGQMCAIKMLDKFKYTGGTHTGDSLAREVVILKRLSHPNIIRVFDVIDTDRMLYDEMMMLFLFVVVVSKL
jgi:hypothetical protein